MVMKNNGDFLIFISLLIFGTYALFLRFFPNIPTLTFLFFFQLIGAICFLGMLIRQGFRKLEKKQLVLLGALTFVALANDLLFFSALRLTKVANAVLPHQMSDLFLIFLAPLLLNKKTVRHEWGTLVLSLIGLVIIYRKSLEIQSSSDIAGITFALLSAFFLAWVIILYQYLPKIDLSIITINFWRYTLSTIVLIPFMFMFGGFNFGLNNIPPLILFGLLFAVIAAGINTYGISKTRPLHASIILKSESVIASFYAFLFLKEIPSVETLIGGVLIISSSLWLTLKAKAS